MSEEEKALADVVINMMEDRIEILEMAGYNSINTGVGGVYIWVGNIEIKSRHNLPYIKVRVENTKKEFSMRIFDSEEAEILTKNFNAKSVGLTSKIKKQLIEFVNLNLIILTNHWSNPTEFDTMYLSRNLTPLKK
ncbi:MAG: hypothetical protein HOB92_07740 [Candidatus Cloacimonetes bacterium]|jgi:hypothetical protein|nr:hypothetical protein [Candidatus Cloacimonadota bacterium]